MLTIVTMTGADDSTDHSALLDVDRQFDFVEWGILVYNHSIGAVRFPSRKWIDDLLSNPPRRLSCHFCGPQVTSLYKGNVARELVEQFQRVQINLHGLDLRSLYSDFDALRFLDVMNSFPRIEWIIQMDGVNEHIFHTLRGKAKVVPLFDKSGGAGISPDVWPQPIGPYSGYAGGIGPDNIVDQIRAIKKVVGESYPFWIDMETKIRSDNGCVFCLDKVSDCLYKSKIFIN